MKTDTTSVATRRFKRLLGIACSLSPCSAESEKHLNANAVTRHAIAQALLHAEFPRCRPLHDGVTRLAIEEDAPQGGFNLPWP